VIDKMKTMYQIARERAKKTRKRACLELGIGMKTLQNYEAGVTTCPPDVAVKMGEAYGDPRLTALYCRRECAIGRRYCYEVLNNVDLSPVATLMKFAEERREVDALLDRLAAAVINRRSRESLSGQEIRQLENDMLEFFDLEHVIETLKLEMWDFLDVAGLVKRHNVKCKERGYVCGTKEKTARLEAAI
jgi:hypothetical protein